MRLIGARRLLVVGRRELGAETLEAFEQLALRVRKVIEHGDEVRDCL